MTRAMVKNGKVVIIIDSSTAKRFIYKQNINANRIGARTQSPIVLTVTTTSSSCSYSNGSAIINATGGTPPYLFTMVSGGSQNTGYFPNLGPYAYDFIVSDAAGQSATITVTIPDILPGPTISVVGSTPASGCATSDATITVQASGGQPPYQYSMDMINFQASNVFTGLNNGSLYFYVKDANGCIASAINAFGYTFNLGCSLALGFTTSGGTCTNTGIIDIHVIEQVNSPYTYSLDGAPYVAVGHWENLGPGIHQVRIQGANGQIYLVLIDLPRFCDIAINFITVEAACQQSNGAITVNASGGATPYTYSIDGINYQSSNTFTGLGAGNYPVTVRDANGFTRSSIAAVYDRCPAVSLSTTVETCGLHDGTITATATNGTAPYEYSIDGTNFQTSNQFTGLSAGPYTITLRDALGFTTTASINVGNGCLNVTATPLNASCGNNNGSISALASNGTPPYLYSLDGTNFQSSNTFNGLAPGVYTVTAKDINNHVGTASVTIGNIAGPQIIASSTSASCSNNDGVITINAIGGTAPLRFSVDGTNYVTTNIFNNLVSGNYTAWVKDANNCLASQTITVTMNCPIVTATVSNETCNNHNGTISAIASGGTAPYRFSIDGTNFQTNNIFSNLSAGTYTVTVKDAINVSNTTIATIVNVCPTVSVTVTNGLCGTANASINAQGANGNPPYQYSIDGINFQSANNFTGLASGYYTITIKDASGLTNSVTTSVLNFPGPAISADYNVANCLNNNVTIQVLATDGTLPIVFSLDGSNFQTGNSFTNEASGPHNAIIKDANGCTATQSFTVPLVSNLVITPGNNAIICEGDAIMLPIASNGTGFIWTPSTALDNPNQLNPHASPAVTTTYYITATLGVCSAKDSITVSVNPAPFAVAGNDSTICYGQSIQLNGAGGIGFDWTPATYLSNAQVPDPIVSHPPSSITYSLRVTDANGCKSLQSSTVHISVTTPPKVFAGNDTSIVMNKPFMLKAIDLNNSGFIQYSWSPTLDLNNSNVQNPVTVLNRDITYTVTAITPAGCVGTDEINIKVFVGPEIYVASAFTPNNDGRNDILKAIPVGIKDFKYFIIYDRWGQRIFYTHDPSNGWDGKSKSVLLDTGVYVWIAEGIDDNGKAINRKGTVTLIR